MKELDRRVGPKSYPKRKSMIALEESGHFKFIEFRRDYFEQLAAYTADMDRNEDYRRRYRQWLSDAGKTQHGRFHDTWQNRVTFLTSVTPGGSIDT